MPRPRRCAGCARRAQRPGAAAEAHVATDLLIVADEDEPCRNVNLWMQRLLPNARLALFPASGHAVNLEERALCNATLERFLSEVERGA
jgi:proline iminopeptidase